MLKPFAIPPLNIIQQPSNSAQQNRMDAEANAEAARQGLKISLLFSDKNHMCIASHKGLLTDIRIRTKTKLRKASNTDKWSHKTCKSSLNDYDIRDIEPKKLG